MAEDPKTNPNILAAREQSLIVDQADAPEAVPHGIRISKLVQPELDAINPTAEPDTAVPGMPSLPAVFNALEKQLGLKVMTQTIPLEMLIVDHVERNPTAN